MSLLVALPATSFAASIGYGLISHNQWDYPAFHLAFASLAFGIFYPLSLNALNSKHLNYSKAMDNHGAFAFLGNMSFGASLYFIYKFISESPYEHLSTPHGNMGALIALLIGGQAIGGILLANAPLPRSVKKIISGIHGIVGPISYVLLSLNLYFGTKSRLFEKIALATGFDSYTTIVRSTIIALVVGVFVTRIRASKNVAIKSKKDL